MATVKWVASLTDQGTVLTTELNSVANNAFSAAGPDYDNTTKKDRWGWLQFIGGGSITPTAGAVLHVYMSLSLDGTNFDDPASSTNPATHQLVAVMSVQTGAHTVKAVSRAPFDLPPTHMKFVLKNQAGVTLSASGNTLRLFTTNEAVA